MILKKKVEVLQQKYHQTLRITSYSKVSAIGLGWLIAYIKPFAYTVAVFLIINELFSYIHVQF